MPRDAPRRSTDEQVALVNVAPVRVQPGKRTRVSFAPAKSGSRSTQSSNVTSVIVQSRKLTESSLQLRNDIRLISPEKACTPARTHPFSQVSTKVDSARSTATNRVSPSHTSDIRHLRSVPPLNVTPVMADSIHRVPLAVTSASTGSPSDWSLISTPP